MVVEDGYRRDRFSLGVKKMAKLPRRYTEHELATLKVCIKPYERWTVGERKLWAIECYGFRHFAAANITPLEHYRRKP